MGLEMFWSGGLWYLVSWNWASSFFRVGCIWIWLKDGHKHLGEEKRADWIWRRRRSKFTTMKRIPRIKFPKRHPQSDSLGLSHFQFVFCLYRHEFCAFWLKESVLENWAARFRMGRSDYSSQMDSVHSVLMLKGVIFSCCCYRFLGSTQFKRGDDDSGDWIFHWMESICLDGCVCWALGCLPIKRECNKLICSCSLRITNSVRSIKLIWEIYAQGF